MLNPYFVFSCAILTCIRQLILRLFILAYLLIFCNSLILSTDCIKWINGARYFTLFRCVLFYFPWIAVYIYKETDNCSTCLLKKPKVNLKEGKNVSKIPGFPGEVINIDLEGPMAEAIGTRPEVSEADPQRTKRYQD